MKHIVDVQAMPGYVLKLRFDDGVEGAVNLSAEVGNGMFAAWKDQKHFASVKFVQKGRSLEWPGEIDLCADALYLEVTGKKPEGLFPALKSEPAHA